MAQQAHATGMAQQAHANQLPDLDLFVFEERQQDAQGREELVLSIMHISKDKKFLGENLFVLDKTYLRISAEIGAYSEALTAIFPASPHPCVCAAACNKYRDVATIWSNPLWVTDCE